MSTSTSPSSAALTRTSQAEKADRLRRSYGQGWTPPPRISVPDWADRYRKLAKEAGSTSGNWETATVEVARGPMLAVTEPGVHIITVMVATQLLKTSLLENTFGYFAHLDPCPMLLLQPKEDAAEQFSKERIAPMVRVTPVLKALISTGRTRTSDETLLYKSFPGGFLALAGAGSPDNLARRPIRVVLADEIDKYLASREGDPIALVEERTATFGANWLSVRACSPTIEDESRIEASYRASDQRHASVECPHCGHRQFLDFFKHVEWTKDGDRHQPKTARVHCESCSAIWSEGERLGSLRTVRWHQTRPFSCCDKRHVPLELYSLVWRNKEQSPLNLVWDWSRSDRHAVYRAKCPNCGKWGVDNEHAGFQAGKLYSPWQKDKPSDIAAKWLAAQGDEDKKQAWWNTQAGLPYRPHSGKELQLEALAARCDHFAAEVPDGVAVVVAGGDLQDDRIEIEVVGWGQNEESWSIDYHVIEGDPETGEFWDRVDAFLKKIWRRGDGLGFEVMAACIDSGGHYTQKVYEFAKARLGRRIWAVKGESARSGQRSPVWPTKKPSKRSKASFRPVIIGVNAAKDTIRARLHIQAAGAGFMHFPADRDINYFAQLTAERIVVKQVHGQKFRVWELPRGRANEALDCRVYAYAALCGLLHVGLKLNKRADEMARKKTSNPPPKVERPERTERPEKALVVPPLAVPQKPPRSIVDRLA